MLPAVEDQIEFRDATGTPRVLRGVIKIESHRSVTISRRDGDWEIPRDRITKIVRRTKRTNPVASMIDAARARDEAEKQAAFKEFYNAIIAVEASRERNDPPEALRALLDEVSRTRKAWRAMR